MSGRLTVYFRPAIDVADRHTIEDAIIDILNIEVAGGGQMLDGSETDIAVFVEDPSMDIPRLMDFLRHLALPVTVSIVEEDETAHVIAPTTNT